MNDGHLFMARVFYILALFLVAYLCACGINSVIDWVADQLRNRRDRR